MYYIFSSNEHKPVILNMYHNIIYILADMTFFPYTLYLQYFKIREMILFISIIVYFLGVYIAKITSLYLKQCHSHVIHNIFLWDFKLSENMNMCKIKISIIHQNFKNKNKRRVAHKKCPQYNQNHKFLTVICNTFFCQHMFSFSCDV